MFFTFEVFFQSLRFKCFFSWKLKKINTCKKQKNLLLKMGFKKKYLSINDLHGYSLHTDTIGSFQAYIHNT